MNAFSSLAPPGMTWRETMTERGGTHVYYSGTPTPRGVGQIGWGLLVIGIVWEVLIVMVFGLGTTPKDMLVTQILPVCGIGGGGLLLWMWRSGGPSSGSLDIEGTSLRASRGLLFNPIQIDAREIAQVVVGNREQSYDVAANGYEVRDTDEWYLVTVITTANKQHVIASFGEGACATFFARRVSALLGKTGDAL